MAKQQRTGKYFPQDYPKFKIVKSFKKLRSPRTILIATEDPDEWFYDIIEIMTKTGEVANISGWITAEQIQARTDWYKRLGWEEI